MISLKCPKCQTVLKVDEAQAGTVSSCPGCGVKLRIPKPKGPSPSQPTSTPAKKTSPQSKPTGRQTAIQAKTAKPPSDPSVRPAGPNASPPEPLAEEEFEYSLDDIEEPEVPAPPKTRRGVKIEVEDEPDEEIDEEEDEIDEDEDEEEDEEEEDEDEEAEDELPRKRKKKKKGDGSGLVVPIVIGIGLFLVVGCTGSLYFVFTRKKPPPDPSKAIAAIEKRGGKYVVDQNDPEHPVVEVIFQGTDADNGDLELLRAFPKLQKLNLANCTKINNPGLVWLEELHELRVLRLNFCSHVSDGGMESVGKLTNLEELYLDQTIVTELGMRDLRGLKKLKKIGLSGTLADGRSLESAIPGLEIIK